MEINISQADDGSILFEWIADDIRFGIKLEADISESRWQFVAGDGRTEGGRLPDDLILLLMIGKRRLDAAALMIRKLDKE